MVYQTMSNHYTICYFVWLYSLIVTEPSFGERSSRRSQKSQENCLKLNITKLKVRVNRVGNSINVAHKVELANADVETQQSTHPVNALC